MLVGDETARVFAGQAVLWPAGVVHGASTDVSEMRAIVVELAGADDHELRGILDGAALALPAGPVARGRAPSSTTVRAPMTPPMASRSRARPGRPPRAGPRTGVVAPHTSSSVPSSAWIGKAP